MVRYGVRNSRRVNRGRREADGQALSRRLVQLMICLSIFAVVYVSKGVFPHRLQRLSQDVITLVGTTTDLRGALSDLGESLVDGESMVGELGAFCIEVFGGETKDAVPVSNLTYPTLSNPVDTAMTRPILFHMPDAVTREETSSVQEVPAPQEVTEQQTSTSPGMSVGAVYIAASGNLQSLPTGYTYDMLSLGNMERTTPVLGIISSDFGYRTHPISGGESIHNGVDIVGAVGDPIHAFGNGTVEYIGESDIYGLYFCIDHENGVKSFYAHCSDLYVHKGDSVSTGDVVAAVGATGNVTGSHLHFELRCNNIRIDPALYIDSL